MRIDLRRDAVAAERDEFRPHADLRRCRRRCARLTVATGVPAKLAAPSRTSQGRMFIPGEPMKCPTKVCAGRSNRSTGEPICTTSPSCITTTWSAKVSASVWSWVT